MGEFCYINGLGLVSAQKTLDNSQFLTEIVPTGPEFFRCQEPNYKEYVAGDMVRRMSRIIKMGISASKICLNDAGFRLPDNGYELPDAIITGTGLGCLEDTEKFLTNLIRNHEELLTPTSFIQSTHNTVSGQIALLLKCHAYNFTYCHRGFSFESALLDAIIRIRNGESRTVLTGGMDELTTNAFRITQRLGHWKKDPAGMTNLYSDKKRGSVAGEGAGFFLLSGEKTENSFAVFNDMTTLYKPTGDADIRQKMSEFLNKNGLDFSRIDLFVMGLNGDPGGDASYRAMIASLPSNANIAVFKHLSGEFHTSGIFALWLSSMVLRHATVPEAVRFSGDFDRPVNNILICNNYRNIEHTFTLVGSV